MKGYAALAGTLAEHGVESIFGVLGNGNMFTIGNWIAEHEGNYVAAANEAGAVLMAAGCANAADRVGVATVTYGPGLANALAALTSAARERSAVVVLSGDAVYAQRGHTQQIDQAALVAPTGAGYEQALSPRSMAADLRRALWRAAVERRPIVFSVSAEFTFAEVEGGAPAPRPVMGPGQRPSPDPAAMDAVVGLIASARRPLILAGAGARTSAARVALERLANAIGAPLCTTLPAKGLFHGNEYDLGVLGSFSTPGTVEAIQAADCVIAVGAGLHRLTAGGDGWPYFQGKAVVQCDADPSALGREYAIDAGVVADATAFAEMVVEWLAEAEHTATTFRTTLPHRGRAARWQDGAAAPGTVDIDQALLALNDALPPQRCIALDGGRFASHAVAHLEVARPQAWSCSFRGFGAVGNAVSTAIGMSCAAAGAPTVAVVGDGGFMLGGLAEFNTAVRHGLDLVVFVCNDGTYGSEYRKLKAREFDVRSCVFAWPEFAEVAESLGGRGFSIRNADDLARLPAVIQERDRPLLIDVKLDPVSPAFTD
ncbi:thiamine pyrophosphate-binding protein [Dactylosporangium sp. NPDC000244]|uniref:thiamine pyrophosphate-binding protein n=1 Tax=Dactylosporangium sp. NPDC000244 TaxID=3154365 RepID=UPI00332FE231